MIPLAAFEAVIDASGVAPRIEAMLPAGVRARQLKVRTLLAGMCLAQADHRPAHLTRVHHALTAALDGGSGLPRLDTSRLRATWLAEVAGLLGLATFMTAAGISCSQRLGDLVAGLEPAGEAGAVRLLGAGRRP